VVTHIIEEKPPSRIVELLNESMAAALSKWDLCPHVAESAVWVIPMTTQRIVCEDCARLDDTSWQHARCALCGDPETVLLAHTLVAALPGWPGQWVTWLLGGICVACVHQELDIRVVA
jgi:hypothetical protein